MAYRRGTGGRPAIHPEGSGDRLSLQLHPEYREKVDRLQDMLNVKYAPAKFNYRNDAVHWAIDMAIKMLEGEGVVSKKKH